MTSFGPSRRAHLLDLPHSTVKHHLANARSKVGATTTAQLVWIRAELLPEPGSRLTVQGRHAPEAGPRAVSDRERRIGAARVAGSVAGVMTSPPAARSRERASGRTGRRE